MVVRYGTSSIAHVAKRMLQLEGSVFPAALAVAIPNAIITLAVKLSVKESLPAATLADFGLPDILMDNSLWNSFTVLVGFLVVFRTGEAVRRFSAGCSSTHTLRANWFTACCECLAFCKTSTAPQAQIGTFQQTLVRMFSLWHALALAEIEDCESSTTTDVRALSYPLLDVQGLAKDALVRVRDSPTKVELVYQWIQQLVVENIACGVLEIPPPLLSQVFSKLASGMLSFHEAMLISTTPFPFPYAQTAQWLLVFHWVAVPVIATQWVSSAGWAFVFSFLQVFVLWALNFIAVEIENPFGMDANDIDAQAMQIELNEFLHQVLLESQRPVPQLSEKVRQTVTSPSQTTKYLIRRASLQQVWESDVDSFSSSSGSHIPSERTAQTSEAASVWSHHQSRASRQSKPASQPSQPRSASQGSEILQAHSDPNRLGSPHSDRQVTFFSQQDKLQPQPQAHNLSDRGPQTGSSNPSSSAASYAAERAVVTRKYSMSKSVRTRRKSTHTVEPWLRKGTASSQDLSERSDHLEGPVRLGFEGFGGNQSQSMNFSVASPGDRSEVFITPLVSNANSNPSLPMQRRLSSGQPKPSEKVLSPIDETLQGEAALARMNRVGKGRSGEELPAFETFTSYHV